MLPIRNRVNRKKSPKLKRWHLVMVLTVCLGTFVGIARYRQTGAVAWWVSSSRRSLRIRKCGHTPCAKANQPVAWTQDDLEVADDYDGILVLGGGFKSDGTLNMWSQRRLDASVDLQKLQVKPCPIVCLGGGTPHRPPVIDPQGFPIHEATICANYLLASSVHPDLILKEISSYDTVGNVFFGLTIHALPAQWRKLAVVTSNFHMPRAIALFQDMLMLAAKDYAPHSAQFSADYIPVSDAGIFSDDALEQRKAKEAKSIQTWKGEVKGLTSLRDLHGWLHRTHVCYSVSRQSEFGSVGAHDNEALKQSY